MSLNKVINLALKGALAVTLLGIALIPLIYISGHECLHSQRWSDDLEFHSPREAQIDSVVASPITNLYLRDGEPKLTWTDVRYTASLADYVSH